MQGRCYSQPIGANALHWLIGAHLCAIATAPGLTCMIYELLAYGVRDWISLEGLISKVLLLVPAYVLCGVPTAMAVIVASLLTKAVSHLDKGWVGAVSAACCGGIVGWVICYILLGAFEGEEQLPQVRTAAAIVGAVESLLLYSAWRHFSVTRPCVNLPG
jgi:hypothetical protein